MTEQSIERIADLLEHRLPRPDEQPTLHDRFMMAALTGLQRQARRIASLTGVITKLKKGRA